MRRSGSWMWASEPAGVLKVSLHSGFLGGVMGAYAKVSLVDLKKAIYAAATSRDSWLT
jgi:hypothetical protein